MIVLHPHSASGLFLSLGKVFHLLHADTKQRIPKRASLSPLQPHPYPHLSSTVLQLVLWSCQEPPGFSEAASRGGVQNPKWPSTAFSWSSGHLLANALHTSHMNHKPCPESLQHFPSLLSSKPCSSPPPFFSSEKETGNKAATAMQEAEKPRLPCLGV